MIDEQEIVMNLADILADIYLWESALIRLEKNKKAGTEEEKVKMMETCCQLYAYEASQRVRRIGREMIDSYTNGMERKLLRYCLRKLTHINSVNPKALRREIAADAFEKGGYFC